MYVCWIGILVMTLGYFALRRSSRLRGFPWPSAWRQRLQGWPCCSESRSLLVRQRSHVPFRASLGVSSRLSFAQIPSMASGTPVDLNFCCCSSFASAKEDMCTSARRAKAGYSWRAAIRGGHCSSHRAQMLLIAASL